jgi:hypothetical protein
MGQITLRGMDPEIENQIRMMAKKSGKSINKLILDIIYQHSGLDKKGKKTRAYSLRKLAGGWNEKEAFEFMKSIKSCEEIDEEMWK